MTDREAFEAWATQAELGITRKPLFDGGHGRYQDIRTHVTWIAWQAATEVERERCAKKCNAIAEERWALYKGRPPYTGRESGRASDFVQGQSDGAEQCADAIRKGE